MLVEVEITKEEAIFLFMFIEVEEAIRETGVLYGYELLAGLTSY